ncbi:uncharacterized protein LOC142973889 [Anticarsia gemmatalis]|uniref:uncharacterized protein LOC142973889 n=1 Tax=Anticarsia gemmatalis TaxID=129554 RepID=UPI003F75B5C3
MGDKNLFATIFIFAFVLHGIKGEDCETYDGNGLCIKACPKGMVLYSSDCVTPTMSRRTCREPEPRSLGPLCDYTRCECPQGKVYDEAADKCVCLRNCSDQSYVKPSDVF